MFGADEEAVSGFSSFFGFSPPAASLESSVPLVLLLSLLFASFEAGFDSESCISGPLATSANFWPDSLFAAWLAESFAVDEASVSIFASEDAEEPDVAVVEVIALFDATLLAPEAFVDKTLFGKDG